MLVCSNHNSSPSQKHKRTRSFALKIVTRENGTRFWEEDGEQLTFNCDVDCQANIMVGFMQST